ncbi:MAG: DUF4870 domain-containing protein [Oscillospiraceae bacterium]|jgi:uncharacterized membrane protein
MRGDVVSGMDEKTQSGQGKNNVDEHQHEQPSGYGRPDANSVPNWGRTYRNPYTGEPQNWQRQNTPNRSSVPSDEKAISALSYIGILWLVGLFVDRENPNVIFHVNQGILLSIFEFALMFSIGVVKAIIQIVFGFALGGFGLFSWMGNLFGGLLSLAGWCLVVSYIIIGVVHAVQGKKEPLPLIGNLFTVVH